MYCVYRPVTGCMQSCTGPCTSHLDQLLHQQSQSLAWRADNTQGFAWLQHECDALQLHGAIRSQG